MSPNLKGIGVDGVSPKMEKKYSLTTHNQNKLHQSEFQPSPSDSSLNGSQINHSHFNNCTVYKEDFPHVLTPIKSMMRPNPLQEMRTSTVEKPIGHENMFGKEFETSQQM